MKPKIIFPLACAFLFGAMRHASAETTAFTYQGRLTDNGEPANGTYDILFRPFGVFTGGSQLTIPNTRFVIVSNGFFTTTMDFGPLIFDGDPVYLQLEVRTNGGPGYATLTPRQPLTPTPYAIHARGASWSNLTGVAVGSGLNVSAGNTFSVNFAGDGSANAAARSDHDHFGETWLGTNSSFGLSIRNSASDGLGLQGRQGTGSGLIGLTAGLWGDSSDSHGVIGTTINDRGVYGTATGMTGANYGVYGSSPSTSGRGVFGYASATNGNAYGVHAVSDSADGRALFAHSTATSGSGGASAVYALADWYFNYSVYARHYGGSGLNASSQGQTAILADSGGTGVIGLGNSTGLKGVAKGYANIFVFATGVEGSTAYPQGTGVAGYSTATTGDGRGVSGGSESASGYGGYFYNSANGIGLYAHGYGAGYAKAAFKAENSETDGGVAGYFYNNSQYTNARFENDGTGDVLNLLNGGTDASGTDGGSFIVCANKPDNDVQFRVVSNGAVFSDVGYFTPAADFAEMLPAHDGLEPGDVLVIGIDGKLLRSTQANDENVVGVYSTAPGFCGGRPVNGETPGKIPLAIVGIVPVKVSAENGAIRPGNLLVASTRAGHAMRANPNPATGTTIGKALEKFDGPATGTIKVLVNLK